MASRSTPPTDLEGLGNFHAVTIFSLEHWAEQIEFLTDPSDEEYAAGGGGLVIKADMHTRHGQNGWYTGHVSTGFRSPVPKGSELFLDLATNVRERVIPLIAGRLQVIS
jgi:hypothetical protein